MKKILIIHCIIIAKYLNIYKFIRFLYYKYDDFTNSNILKDNINLYNIHKGKRCFIICSGESLNEFDFLKIKDEISISCSFINYHRNYSDLDLNYYVSIPSHIELYNSHNKSHISKWQINKEKDIEFFYKDVEKGRFTVEPYEYYSKIDCDLGNETILILNSISKSFVRQNHLFSKKKVYYIKQVLNSNVIENNKFDLTKRINFFGSSLFTMMNIAIFSGFKKLYLVGADYTYNPSRQHHFYDYFSFSKSLGEVRFKRLVDDYSVYTGMICNNILEDEKYYYPKFVKRKFDNSKHIKYNSFAKTNNIEIYNVVPDNCETKIYKQLKYSNI